MEESLFRQKSIDRIASPEQLNDYMRVTSPTIWVVLAAVILLLVGALIWSSTAQIVSFASGTAQVENGSMVVRFDDQQTARKVKTGMTVTVGGSEATITSIGTTENGGIFAVADTTLANGSYPASVTYRRTEVLELLFN